jgi:magnesium-transporting ATPase (P-type)
MFTGESQVTKKEAFGESSGGNCILLAHSLINRGYGKAIVVAVGQNTQAGKLMQMTVSQNEMT